MFDVLLDDHLTLHVVLLLLFLFGHRLRRHHRVLHDRAREGNRVLHRLDDGTGERLDDGAGENLLCILLLLLLNFLLFVDDESLGC